MLNIFKKPWIRVGGGENTFACATMRCIVAALFVLAQGGRKSPTRRDADWYANDSQSSSFPWCQRQRCGSLNASTIPKFKVPLVIPPVMNSSRRNHYDIAVRRFKQQILPGGIWKNKMWKEIIGEQGDWDYPATTVFGYGNARDAEPDSSNLGGGKGIAPAANSQSNYPGYTIEAVKDVSMTVNWINGLVYDSWHKPWYKRCWRNCKACKFVRHIFAVDQSLHWANPGQLLCRDGFRHTDCKPAENRVLKRPYRGPIPHVTHLHGGHTQAPSDGYPEAWSLPAACNIPEGYDFTGAMVNQFGVETNKRPGVASFTYPNDQPSATLWYHDHTLGITRLNVHAGMVGFCLLRERNGSETGLVNGTLPRPAPVEGQGFEETNFPGHRRKFREIPIVIQDKCFNKDGSLFYPDNRAYYEKRNRWQLRIPFIGDHSTPESDIPPIWNPNAFFDVMVVNGVAWPLHDVEPDLYRFRLLNGCGSRFLNLALFLVKEGEPDSTQELPFYQIGGDQGLLPKVVKVITGCSIELEGNGTDPDCKPVAGREALLLGPAERADVIIDFTGLQAGQRVRMINTAPDSLFERFNSTTVPADPRTSGQVMEFLIVPDTSIGEDATRPEWLQLSLADANVSPFTVERDLALVARASKTICANPRPLRSIVWDRDALPRAESEECVDPQGNLADSRAFFPWAILFGTGGRSAGTINLTLWEDGINQNPRLGSTERWEFWNWSPASHPMHLHPIKCRLISRQGFNMTTEQLVGSPKYAEKRDAGWKDSIIAFPEEVTTIECHFDIEGAFVWHCHLLEHEDNEMMAPYCIGNLSTAPGCSTVGKFTPAAANMQGQGQGQHEELESADEDEDADAEAVPPNADNGYHSLIPEEAHRHGEEALVEGSIDEKAVALPAAEQVDGEGINFNQSSQPRAKKEDQEQSAGQQASHDGKRARDGA